MLVTVLDVGQTAGILAGGVLGLTHGLIQCRITGLVLGIDGDIVVPCRAVNGGHGQRHEEGIAGAGDILGNAGLHHQIQALLKIFRGGVTICTGFRHSHAALHIRFQRIFHGGGIGGQGSGQLVVQQIGSVVVFAVFALVGICGGHADGGQHGVRAVKAVQHAYLTLAVHHLIIHGDVGHAEVGKLHALHGVFCQLVDNGIVMQAGADIGFRVPRAVLAGHGDVVFIDVQGRFLAGVDGRRRICCGERRGHQADDHKRRQQQRHYAMDLFHVQLFSFLNSDFLQK